MTQLRVSEDELWVDAFGVAPRTEEVSGDEFVREVRVVSGDEDELHVTWDVLHGSVRVRHRRADRLMVELHREQATLLRVESAEQRTAVVIEYSAPEAFGRAWIQVWPEVLIEDRFMRG